MIQTKIRYLIISFITCSCATQQIQEEGCQSTYDCPSGQACVNSICHKICQGDENCEANQICQEEICRELVEQIECEQDGDCQNKPICHDFGRCVGGRCEYSPTPGISCDDGDLCTLNDFCNETGQCIGQQKSCLYPPANSCINNDSVYLSYDNQGWCDDFGECQYDSHEIPCGNCSQNCSGLCDNILCETQNGGCKIGHCDPFAEPVGCQYEDVSNGTPCNTESNDESGVCLDGRCVDCSNVHGICAPRRCENGIIYENSFCTATGECPPAEERSCKGFLCDDAVNCLSACENSNHCLEDFYCLEGKCSSEQKDNGESCTIHEECGSGFCINDYCCNSACSDECSRCNLEENLGTCVADDSQCGECGECDWNGANFVCEPRSCGGCGVCEPDLEGKYQCEAGTCSGCDVCQANTDGNFQCEFACTGSNVCLEGQCVDCNNVGEICAPRRCEHGIIYENSFCTATGECPTAEEQSCQGFLCGDSVNCLSACEDFDDCREGFYCLEGKCSSEQKDDGESCSITEECTSGFCINGYCCDSACSDECLRCDVAENLGTCTPDDSQCGECGECNWNSANFVCERGDCDGCGVCEPDDEGKYQCEAGTCSGCGDCQANANGDFQCVEGTCLGCGVCQQTDVDFEFACVPGDCSGCGDCRANANGDFRCVAGICTGCGVCQQTAVDFEFACVRGNNCAGCTRCIGGAAPNFTCEPVNTNCPKCKKCNPDGFCVNQSRCTYDSRCRSGTPPTGCATEGGTAGSCACDGLGSCLLRWGCPPTNSTASCLGAFSQDDGIIQFCDHSNWFCNDDSCE